MLEAGPKRLLIIALVPTFRSELSSIKSNTEVMVHGLSNIRKTLPDVEARVSELSGILMSTSQTATQSVQKIERVVNLAMSSHEASLRQLGQARSNEFREIKQLIQDLSRKIDANASNGSKVGTISFCPMGGLLLTECLCKKLKCTGTQLVSFRSQAH